MSKRKDDDFEPTRWWRVMRDGRLWSETSSESDARSRMVSGDVLERLYERTESEWRHADTDSA
jgi:hypothetical protein